MDPEDFRRLGHELIDWVADYRERLEELPVMSRVRPGEIRAMMPSRPPEHGDGLAGIVEDLDQIVLPGITHWNHPGWFAYFPSNTDLSSVLGDLVSSGLGPQGMNWITSPACTEVEDVVMDWLRQAVGLSQAFTGVIHDSASSATFCALLCARERTTDFSQNGGGLQAEDAPLVVYASDQAHSSVQKGALLAGFGAEHLRLVETDDKYALRPDALEEAIAADLAAGRRPCALVASIGTTATTALDPLRRLTEIAERHALWLHVDAALAGTAMVCPELRWMWDGIERADSLVFNPHKWMGAGFDLSAYYVRDPDHLVRVMSTDPSYLRTAQDGLVRNLRDWGIPLGRRFRALKLWFVLRDQGVEGVRERVRRDIANARWLAEQVDAAAGWQRLAPAPLQTVCLRHVPSGAVTAAAEDGERRRGDASESGGASERGDAEAASLTEEGLAAHNLAIAERVNAGGRFYLTSSDVKGKRALRVSVGAEATERRHVEALWAALQEAAR
ncbi:MAG TPA: pyridoxal-dependent decarboxylase [Thermoleophilia bacterium]|nr:pyridoxal-dependent decarboxylase [Thermoleophilia bacterium]HQG03435.1 pyridoxal-dependent decarboxylase [Thermoleophilia bacterium]HQG55045.1 pyridoxal-dependent decarboxylase [Thermoleophilia bacterium]HQJ97896.1 pyridoxal-dependent decarboxylase [Thermoleophilia bacterium]